MVHKNLAEIFVYTVMVYKHACYARLLIFEANYPLLKSTVLRSMSCKSQICTVYQLLGNEQLSPLIKTGKVCMQESWISNSDQLCDYCI